MSADKGAYWLTMAQILPVLALALVVEARVFTRQLTMAFPKGSRRVLSIMYGLIILPMVWVVPEALIAARGGRVPSWLDTMAEQLIGFSLAALVTPPLVDLVTGAWAETVARLVTLLQRWRLNRSMKKTLRSNANMLDNMSEVEALIPRMNEGLGHVEGWLADARARGLKGTGAKVEWNEEKLQEMMGDPSVLDDVDALEGLRAWMVQQITRSRSLVGETQRIAEDVERHRDTAAARQQRVIERIAAEIMRHAAHPEERAEVTEVTEKAGRKGGPGVSRPASRNARRVARGRVRPR